MRESESNSEDNVHVHPFIENTDYENLSIGKWGIED